MTIEFKLPAIADGVHTADIAEIVVSAGDVIEAGQVVMEVETEKAVAEIQCPHAGRVARVLVKPGDTVEIGAPLLAIEEQAAAASQPPAPTSDMPSAKRPSTPTETAPRTVDPALEKTARAVRAPSPDLVPRGNGSAVPTRAASPADPSEGAPSPAVPPPATPSTRRLARELGVDLRRVPGSGPGGRILQEDVQAFVRQITTGAHAPGAANAPSAALVPAGRPDPTDVRAPMSPPPLPDFTRFGPVEREPLSRLARTAAANLAYSWQTIPHVTQHDLADVTELEAARRRYMEGAGRNGPKITMTAIVLKAVVAALRANPRFNASLDLGSGDLILKRFYHVGIAVDTEHGLLVPVVRDADRKSVATIARELQELAEKARARKLSLDDMQGATFTISNLGGIGGTAFTPIVNHPEVAILGLSRTRTELELAGGQVRERLLLPLSLSYDHRVINGADAARFVAGLCHALSDFMRLLVEA